MGWYCQALMRQAQLLWLLALEKSHWLIKQLVLDVMALLHRVPPQMLQISLILSAMERERTTLRVMVQPQL
jgi:hypothetical protein